MKHSLQTIIQKKSNFSLLAWLLAMSFTFNADAQCLTCGANVSINTTLGLCTGTTTLTAPTVADNCMTFVDGNALSFDGVNDYVTIPDESSFDFTSTMTIEMWVRVNPSNTGMLTLISKGDDSWRLHRFPNSNKIAFGTSGLSNGDLLSNTSINDGNWYHIAAVFNGTHKLLYVNGVLDVSVGVSGTISNSNFQVAIGENLQAVNRYYHGSLDNIRIWSTARTQVEILENMNLELSSGSGLVAAYHFNQGSAGGSNAGVTTATNATGNSLNGTLQNFALSGETSNWVLGNVQTGGLLITNNAPATYAIGLNTVIWTSNDGNGNTNTCAQTVTVIDNQPPAITCPATVSVNTATDQCSNIATWTTPTPTDNCSGASIQSVSHASGFTFTKGTTQVTYTVVDAANLTNTCVFNVEVIDNQPPAVTCPAAVSVNTATDQCSNIATWTTPIPTDNCSGASIQSVSHASGSTFAKGTTQVTYSVVDVANLTNTCVFNVEVIDNQPPAITCPATVSVNTANDQCSNIATWTTPIPTDNCSGASIQSVSHTSGSTFAKGTTQVTYTVVDAANMTNTCVFNVEVIDNQLPAITCPATVSVNTATDQCSNIATWTTPTPTDNCSGASILSVSHASGSTFAKGTTQVTYTVVDAANLTNTCVFNVVVADSQAPVITCAPNVAINTTHGLCTGTTSLVAPTVSDNCDVSVTTNGLSLDGSNDFLTTPDIKSFIANTRTVELWFNASSHGVIVDERGQAPPGAGWQDTHIEILPNGNVLVRVWNLNAVTVGNASFNTWNHVVLRYDASQSRLDGFLNGVPSTSSSTGGVQMAGQFYLAFGLSDGTNLGSGAYFNGKMDEIRIWNTARTAAQIQANMNKELTLPQTGLVAYYQLNQGTSGGSNTGLTSATDASGNNLHGTLQNFTLSGTTSNWVTGYSYSNLVTTNNAPATYAIGLNTVTWTVNDGNNTSTCQQTVTVTDIQTPAITCPATVTVNTATDQCSNTASWSTPTPIDNCTGVSIQSLSHTSGSTFQKGSTIVTYTAVDGANNTNTCAFNVVVTDNQLPVITCPANQIMDVVPGTCAQTYIIPAPTTLTDNCPGTLTWNATFSGTGNNPPTNLTNQPSGTASASTSFYNGVTTVILSTTDAANNIGSCSFTVTVVEHIPPTITCASSVTINTTPGLCTGIPQTPLTVSDNCAVSVTSNGLNFDGSNDRITATGFSALTAYTIETWVKITNPSSNQAIITGTSSGGGWSHQLRTIGGKFQHYTATSSGVHQINSTTNIVAGQWYHIAITATNGGQMKLFVNGVEEATTSIGTLWNGLSQFFIGSDNGGGFAMFSGTLDELRIWTAQRTQAQIQASMNNELTMPQTGLAAYYKFNQGATAGPNATVTTATDDSGNNRHGSLQNFALSGATSNWVLGNVQTGGLVVNSNVPGALPLGSTNVIWTVADISNNTATCEQTVAVIDIEVPVLTAPANQSLNTSAGTCTTNYTIADPISDNCTGSTWSAAFSGNAIGNPADISNIADGVNSGVVSFQKGTTTVTLTGVDASSNAAVTKTFTVTVVDNIVPTISGCPGNQSLNVATGTCAQSYSIPAPTTLADNCTGTYTWNATFSGNANGNPTNLTNQSNGTASANLSFSKGATMVTLSATDAVGNTSTANCMFTVTVVDNIAPTITCAANVSINTTTGLCTGTTTLTAPTVADNCLTIVDGNALSFDGVNDYVTIPNESSFDFTNTMTVEMWVRVNPTNTGMLTLISKGDDSWRLHRFSNSNKIAFGTSGLSNVDLHSNASISDGNWYHIAAVFNGTHKLLYVNGVLDVSVAVSGTISNSNFQVAIGENLQAVNRFYQGSLDNIRIWSTARTQVEIQGNMNLELSSGSGLVAAYHFNQGTAGGSNAGVTTATNATGNSLNGVLQNFALSGTNSNWVSGNVQTGGLVITNNAPVTYALGSNTVNWTVNDGNGNTNSCQQTITVTDNQLPAITCPANIAINTAANQCSNTATWTAPTPTDNCSGASIQSVSHVSGSTFQKGTTVVTYTAVDGSNNTNTCAFNVVVTDNQAPVLACPANQSLNAATGTCTQSLAVPAPTTLTDNCPGPLTWNATFSGNANGNPTNLTNQASSTPSASITFNNGVTIVTLSATDAANVPSTVNCTFTVTVLEDVLPTITCAPNVSINTTPGLCTGTTILVAPTAADNCPAFINTNGLQFDGVNDVVNVNTGSNSLNGTFTIEFWAKPSVLKSVGFLGTRSPINFSLDIQLTSIGGLHGVIGNGSNWITTSADASNAGIVAGQWAHIAYVVTPLGYSIYVNGIQKANGTLSGTPLFFDNTHNLKLGNTGHIGDNNYYEGALDELRIWNLARTEAQIQANMSIALPAQSGLVARYHFDQGIAGGSNSGLTTLTDVSGNNFNGTLINFLLSGSTSNWASGVQVQGLIPTSNAPATYSLGLNTVTWTVADVSNNTATCQQTVTVLDNQLPAIVCPANIAINTAADQCSNIATWTTPTPTDNCSGASIQSLSHAIGSTFAKGTTVVTYTAVDGSNNTKTCTFNVVVTDNQTPVIACPANQSFNVATGTCAQSYVIPAPSTLTDNCPGPLTWSAAFSGNTNGNPTNLTNLSSGSASASISFNKGVTIVTLSARDAANNSSTANCTFTVTVVDNIPPTITCAANVSVNTTTGLCTGTTTLTAPTVSDNCNSLLAGNALNFDGSNDFVNSSNNAAFQINSGTIEAWIKTSNAGAAHRGIVAKAWAYALYLNNNVLQAHDWGGGNGNLNTGILLNDNNWHHVALTFQSGVSNGTKIYKDGMLVFTGTMTVLHQNDALGLGNAPDYGQNFGGLIDEARVWNVVRTQAEIQAGMNAELSSAPGLVAAYHLNQGTPGGSNAGVTSATDASGNNLNGTLTNFALSGATSNWVSGAPLGGLTVSNNAPATYALGLNTVTWTANDGTNTSTCQQTVTVTDIQLPAIACPANIAINTAADQCSNIATWTTPTPTDNCSGASIQSLSHAIGSTFAKGTTVVTYTAVDGSNNTNTCTFNVVVTDNQTPVIACPANQSFNVATGTCAQSYVIPAPSTLTDNCPGPLTWSAAFSGNTNGNPTNLTNLSSGAASASISFNKGVTTVTLSARDAANNSSTANCTFTVTVVDNIPPTITCAANVNINTTTGLCTGTTTLTAPAVSDNCIGMGAPTNNAPATYALGLNTVTWTANDGTNTSTCQQTVTVTDIQLPAIACPANIAINTAADQCSNIATWTTPTPTDNCSGASIQSLSHAIGSTFAKGTTVVTYTAVDGSNNTNTCTFNVVVTDNQTPVIACPANQSFNVADGTCAQSFVIPAPSTLTDNCPGPLTWSAAFSGNTNGNPTNLTNLASGAASASISFNKGVTTVTLSARDAANNSSTANCTFTVTVVDNIPPTITCAANVNINTTTGLCTGTTTLVAPAVSDNCFAAIADNAIHLTGNINMTASLPTGFPSGATAKTFECWIYREDSGLRSVGGVMHNGPSGSAFGMLITSNNKLNFWGHFMDVNLDNVNSTLTVPVGEWSHIAYSYDGTTLRGYINGTLVGTANIALNTANNGPLYVGLPYNSMFLGRVDEFRVWNIARTQTQIQGAMSTQLSATESGLVAYYTFNQGVAGGNNAGLNTVTAIVGNPGTLNGFTLNGATSNWVSGFSQTAALILTNNAPATYALGLNTVTWTVNDGTNTSTCQQTVTVTDIQLPAIVCPANIAINTATNQCSNTATWTAPTPTDNCTVSIQSVSNAIGSVFQKGTTIVTYTAVDGSNNTNTCAFNVVVTDNQAPAISCPGTVTVNTAVDQCENIASWTTPTPTDNCPGVSIQSVSHASGSIFAKGTTQVTYTVVDAANLTNTCIFNVVVNDNQAPSIICPGTVTVNTTLGQCENTASWTTPTPTDNCPGVSIQSVSHTSGSIFPSGTTQVTYTVIDAVNLTNTCIFNVVVNDNQSPIITCPANIAINTATDQCSNTATWIVPTPTDNCTVSIQSVSNAIGSVFQKGTTIITYTAVDGSNNTKTCTFNVVVTDNQAPLIACPANQIVVANSSCAGVVGARVLASKNDNCTASSSIPEIQSNSGDGNLSGHNDFETVTITANDGNGNTANCSFTVTLKDQTGPNAPASLSTINALCTATPTAPTATDNCAGTITATSNVAFPITTIGTTVITWTFTDMVGNTSTVTQSVVIVCDQDSDGYLITNDCDDNNPTINPGATEIPNDGVDQNCNGQELCFIDADNDGYRPNLTATIISVDLDCNDTQEALSSEPGGDCNDQNAAVNPAATEICNGVDDDCNGISELTAVCQAPAISMNAVITPTTVDFSWPQTQQNCYVNYRLQYRRSTISNAAWVLKLVNGNSYSTSIARSTLATGSYTWGLRGLCHSNNNWSAVKMGNNFVLTNVTPLLSNGHSNNVIADVFPNPANDRILVYLNASQDKACFVRMTDALGRTVYGQHHELDGVNNFSIPVYEMPNGIYSLTVTIDGQVQTERILVTH